MFWFWWIYLAIYWLFASEWKKHGLCGCIWIYFVEIIIQCTYKSVDNNTSFPISICAHVDICLHATGNIDSICIFYVCQRSCTLQFHRYIWMCHWIFSMCVCVCLNQNYKIKSISDARCNSEIVNGIEATIKIIIDSSHFETFIR